MTLLPDPSLSHTCGDPVSKQGHNRRFQGFDIDILLFWERGTFFSLPHLRNGDNVPWGLSLYPSQQPVGHGPQRRTGQLPGAGAGMSGVRPGSRVEAPPRSAMVLGHGPLGGAHGVRSRLAPPTCPRWGSCPRSRGRASCLSLRGEHTREGGCLQARKGARSLIAQNCEK